MKKIICFLMTVAMALSLAVSVAAQDIHYGNEYVCVTEGYDFSYTEYTPDSPDGYDAFISFNDRYAEMEISGSRSWNAKKEFNEIKKDWLETDGEMFFINGTPAVKSYDDDFVCAFVVTYSDNYLYHIDIETEDTMDCDYLLHLLSTDFYFKGGNTPPVPFGSTRPVAGSSSSVNSAGIGSGSSGSASSSSGSVSGSTITPGAPTTNAPTTSIVTNNYTYPATTSATTTASTNATTAEPVISVVYETVTVQETSASEKPKETTNNLLKIGIIIFVIVALAGLILGIIEIVSGKKKKNS